MKMKIYQTWWDTVKAVLRQQSVELNVYMKKRKKGQKL